MIRRRDAWAVSLCIASGCSAAPMRVEHPMAELSAPSQSFTPRDALLLLAQPSPPPATTPRAPAARWVLDGAVPETWGSVVAGDDDPVTARLRERAAQTGGRALVTAQMQCAAREAVRYAAAREDPMPEGLRAMIAGRCGALDDALSVTSQRVPARRNATPAQRAADLLRALDAPVDAALRSVEGPVDVGVASASLPDRTVLALAALRRRSTLARAALTPADGATLVQGTTIEPARTLDAFVTRGDGSSLRCASDALSAPPDFSFRCETQPGVTRVEVVARAQPQGLWRRVAMAWVGPDRASPMTFDPAPDEAASITDEAAREGLVARWNAARTASGAGALAVSAPETQSLCAVASTLVATGADVARADAIASGVAAGWSVAGTVRRGAVTVLTAPPSADLDAWSREALSRPAARAALLDPTARVAALCPVLRDGRVVAAAAATYTLIDPVERVADLTRFFERLDAARAEVHRGPARRDGSLDAVMRAQAQRVEQGAVDPRAALRAMLEAASAQSRQPVEGWVLRARDDAWPELPSALTNDDGVTAAAALAYRREPGDAWGTLVYFVVRVGR